MTAFIVVLVLAAGIWAVWRLAARARRSPGGPVPAPAGYVVDRRPMRRHESRGGM